MNKNLGSTLARMPETRQRKRIFLKAFTLAETLITLAIIGIVAAMTVPTLMTKFFEKELDSRHKKVMETLRTGYRMMLQKDEVDDVADSTLVRCDKNDKACFNKQHEGIFAGMTTSVDNLPETYYFSNGTTKSPFKWRNMPYVFQTKDGVVYGVNQDENTNSFVVYVDLNGNDEPNVQSKDLYKFRISNEAKVADASKEIDNEGIANFGTNYSPIDCRESNSGSDDYKYCGAHPSGEQNDYWAGANKKCAEVGLTLADSNTIAHYYFNNKGGKDKPRDGLYWTPSEYASTGNPQRLAWRVQLYGGSENSGAAKTNNFNAFCVGN